MTHDLVIRGGSIVDGTGAEAFHGDVAIDDGLITALGKLDESGKREIDAEGHVVSPGFVDLHTHLDAQIGWDPDLTPVSWHGVTTALMGNCGVSFAPCKPADQELLASMMETVEDIPKHAIMTVLPWTWEDYGGYLDAIEKLEPGINVAGLVGHCAVRFYVMGERAVEEQATEVERQQMAEVVGRAIDGGAVGFSTNRYEPTLARERWQGTVQSADVQPEPQGIGGSLREQEHFPEPGRCGSARLANHGCGLVQLRALALDS